MKRDTLHGVKVTVVGGAFLGLVISLILVLERQGAVGCIIGGSDCAFLAGTDLGVVLGVPLPFFLVGYYIALGVAGVLLESRHDHAPELTLGFIALLLVVSVPGSIWLPVTSHVRFGKHCIYCLTLASSNLLMVAILTGYLWPARDLRRILLVVGVGVACLCAPIALMLAVSPSTPAPTPPVVVASGETVAFAPAAVTLELDPSCEHCAAQWPVVEAALAALQAGHRLGPVQILLLPQDTACLQFARPDDVQSHDGACRAAAHVFCAMQQGRALPLLRFVFQSVRNHHGPGFLDLLDDQRYRTIETDLGLDVDRQRLCTGDTAADWTAASMPTPQRAAFARHLAASVAAGLQVPTLIVDGQRVDLHGLDRDGLIRSIEDTLHRSAP